MKKFLLICLVVTGMTGMLSAQNTFDNVPSEHIYHEAKTMFDAKNWVGCIDKLSRFKSEVINKGVANSILNSQLQSKKSTAVINMFEEVDYMLAVANFETGSENALDDLIAYRNDYPDSYNSPVISFLIGTFYFIEEDYPDALTAFEDLEIDQLPVNYQPDYLHRLGVTYLKSNEIEKAEPCFLALSSMNTKYTDSSDYYLAYIDYVKGNYAKALKEFEALPKTGEYSETVPYYIAQIKFLQKEYDVALNSAKRLLNLSPIAEHKAELYRIAGESSYNLGDKHDAIKYLKEYKKLSSKPYRATSYILGMAAYDSFDYPTAIENLAAVTTVDDAVTQNAFLHLGHAYVKNGDLRNARMSFQAAAAANHDMKVKEVAMYNYGLTIVQTSYSPFNESVEVFENFLNLFPESEYSDLVNDHLVEAYMTTKNYESALNSIKKIKSPSTKILKAKQRVLFQLGTQYVVNNDYVNAKNYFTQAIALGELDKENLALAYFWRGESMYKEGDYAAAAADFQKYLNISQQTNSDIYALAKYNLGYSNFKQHKFNDAISWYEQYINVPVEKNKPTYIDALNRIGDSYFYKRSFSKAENYYSQAAALSPTGGDYALFQKGFMAGLQKKYNDKIDAMDKLIGSYPNSEYADDAWMEKGKAYLSLNQGRNAIESFNIVATNYPNTSLARAASIQMALIYFNLNELDNSIQAYKNVIAKYPGSDEARTALEDLKAVYIEKNDIPAYAEYVKSLDGKVQFAAGEQDSLTFLATEKVLIKGNNENSKNALVNYLQSFANGAFRLNANMELARIYESEKDYDNALQYYNIILQAPDSRYTEDALLRSAEIYYTINKMQQALDAYTALILKAEKSENKLKAKTGVLRSNVALNRYDDIIITATNILRDEKINNELLNEAMYQRAISYVTLGRPDEAASDLTELAKDTRTAYGAEAKYLLAEEAFKKGQNDDSEHIVFDLIGSGTPHQYWLAKGFILLTDIYIAKGDLFQARQYLISLQTNYKAEDEINNLIADRFNIISEKEKSKQGE